ncbi:FliM/FliN family flagellar motor switch protein [Amaricoccus tamworthensis]|uniref:FliM/FliN family flagellar motor switch protein n=1 Tax=Amaricoccus tamworthensis TaxID=57002 RepID=UPI003C7DB2A7
MAAGETLLERKLNQTGVARSPLPDPDLLGQTFARQIEEKLRPLIKTTVSAMVLENKIIKVAEANQDISVPSMLGFIDVEHATINGLMVLDTDFTYHLVDLMLGGDPSTAPMAITRSFTEIDTSMCRLPMDAMMQGFVAALTAAFGKPMTKKISITEIRQDITQTRYAADYVDLLAFNIAMDMGDAARSGMMQVLLPLATLDVIYASMQENVVAEDSRPRDLWKKQMRRAASLAPVGIDAVIHKQKMSIGQIQDLAKGDYLLLPDDATNNVELTMSHPGSKKSVIATGRLGAYKDKKVVKLKEDLDDRVTDQISRSLT